MDVGHKHNSFVWWAFGGFGFPFRNWISERIKASIQHEYAQKLEAHKAQLRAESEISIEKLKSQLQITAAERSIKLTEVFEHQAEAITDVFKTRCSAWGLPRLHTDSRIYEYAVKGRKTQSVCGKIRAIFGILYSKKYSPKDTQTSIDAFYNQLQTATLKFMRGRKFVNAEEDTWFQTMNFVNNCVQIMDKLDSDLKKILGLIEGDKMK